MVVCSPHSFVGSLLPGSALDHSTRQSLYTFPCQSAHSNSIISKTSKPHKTKHCLPQNCLCRIRTLKHVHILFITLFRLCNMCPQISAINHHSGRRQNGSQGLDSFGATEVYTGRICEVQSKGTTSILERCNST